MRKLTKASQQAVQENLEQAYNLVITDLFHSLKKLKADQTIKLGELGTLNKKERKTRSPANGKTYVYYLVSFKASQHLKKELDK